MDEKVLAAARLTLKAHCQDDCAGTAAAGVALAQMIVQRATKPPGKFSFKHEMPDPMPDPEQGLEKAGPTVSP